MYFKRIGEGLNINGIGYFASAMMSGCSSVCVSATYGYPGSCCLGHGFVFHMISPA